MEQPQLTTKISIIPGIHPSLKSFEGCYIPKPSTQIDGVTNEQVIKIAEVMTKAWDEIDLIIVGDGTQDTEIFEEEFEESYLTEAIAWVVRLAYSANGLVRETE